MRLIPQKDSKDVLVEFEPRAVEHGQPVSRKSTEQPQQVCGSNLRFCRILCTLRRDYKLPEIVEYATGVRADHIVYLAFVVFDQIDRGFGPESRGCDGAPLFVDESSIFQCCLR